MKNVKAKTLSLALAAIMVVCALVTPALIVSAERNIYSYLEEKELGVEWDAWNSMNNTNFDANGYKIPTAEYIEVVSDPTDSGHGGVLKIGHAEYPTSMSLRLTQPTDVEYSHKFEAQFYLDDAFTTGEKIENYILLKDSDAWTNVGGGNQTKIGLDGITTKKWVDINTEGLAAGNDGVSGNGFQHIDSGYITILFQISLDAGKYLYIDNLNIAAGNDETYLKNIDVSKGDKIIYSHEFKTFEELELVPITSLDSWTVSATNNISKVTENGNTELVIYSGSITQIIDGIPNGKYNISIDYSSNGNTTSIVSMHNIVGSEWKNQRNLKIQESSYGTHTATTTGYEITDNKIRISVWVGAQEGKYVKIDNITVTKEGSTENIVLNGGFELADTPIVGNPTAKANRTVGWGYWASGVGGDSIYVADTGYNSNSSMAITYPVDGSSNINHTVKGLTGGKTYVITAQVKMLSGASPTLFIKNYSGAAKTSVTLPKSETWTLLYKEFTLPEESTQFTLEFYCSGKAGQWFMVDNIKVIELDEDTMTNLVTNGDFEDIVGDVDGNAKINGSDLARLRSSLIGLKDANLVNADVNNDGKVDLLDLVRIKKFVAGANVILGKI